MISQVYVTSVSTASTHNCLDFFDDFEFFDDLDSMRFSHNFQFFMTLCIGIAAILGVSGAVFRGSAI